MQMMIELNVLTSAEISTMPSSKRLALLETFWAQGAAKCGEKGTCIILLIKLEITSLFLFYGARAQRFDDHIMVF